MQILEKGQTLNLDIVSKQEGAAGSHDFYFGMGWDNPNGPVDLDGVAALLVGGKLVADSDLIYFGNMKAAGIEISEDNQTGEGEGDDESIVIRTADLADNVDGVVIGLACYSSGADFANAPNPHFRVCDGDNENSPQIADVNAGNGAAGDTVLVGFHLVKTPEGWVLNNDGQFFAKGTGTDSIRGFAELAK